MQKRIIITLLAGMFLTGFIYAQQSKIDQVSQRVSALSKAMVEGDKIMLEKLTSEKLSYGHSGGKLENQKEFILSLTNGESDFVSIDLKEQSVVISQNVAMVRHILSAKTNDKGVPGEVHLRVLLIWQKYHGTWKLVARQAVKIV